MHHSASTYVPYLILVAIGYLVVSTATRATPVSDDLGEISFDRDIRPIFSENCLTCHGPDEAKREAGLRLDTRDGAMAELPDDGQAIVPGDSNASLLVERISSHDPADRMPPPSAGEPLSNREIELLKRWIDQGAPWQAHWAFGPLKPVTPPQKTDGDEIENPIDAFVLSRLESRGIESSPAADRYTLIKRLHYDLTGLPPTPDEVAAFVGDPSPDAYEQLVDRLLASPHFGERWGRHWLDKARYADTNGYETDGTRTIWPYRDWVIKAINDDMPFDQFTIEQIAGDLLPNPTTNQLLATAFHRNTMTNTEGGTDDEEFRVAAVLDRVNTTMAVWMGLTFGCAQCHDHKYDPISQREYYELFALLNQTADADKNDHSPTAATPSPLLAAPGDSPPATPIMRELPGDQRRKTHIHLRGSFLNQGEAVSPGVPQALHKLPSGSPANRLALARWLVAVENPLAPRVAVNHVWKHLFGAGLVPTAGDFGVRGERPSHPELLDHLADELIHRGWSRKALIKYIVLSATYQQSSRHRPELVDIDPNNRLLYRQNRFRSDGEIVRDVQLAASGLLVRDLGGPSVYPPIPPGITDQNYNSAFKWETSEGDNRYRRGMYTFFKRTAPHPNLTTFDCPESNVTCVGRNRSNTPLGALITLNNEVYIEAAQALGRRLASNESADDRERIRHGFQLCIVRPPTDAEVELLLEVLQSSRQWYRSRSEAAVERVGNYAADGSLDFDAASWIAVARVLLNLDEMIVRD